MVRFSVNLISSTRSLVASGVQSKPHLPAAASTNNNRLTGHRLPVRASRSATAAPTEDLVGEGDGKAPPAAPADLARQDGAALSGAIRSSTGKRPLFGIKQSTFELWMTD